LRSALSSGQRFGDEAQVRAVLEEVTLAQPDRLWQARKRAALKRGDAVEQGAALRDNCEQGCEREESRAGFSGLSSTRIRRNSRGGGDDRGVRDAVWRGGVVTGMQCHARATGNRVRAV
jgi:hypothetical protein